MKLLLDANISFRVVLQLRAEGFDVISIQELNPNETDKKILARALRQKRVVVTYDKDFGDLVFRDNLKHQGVVILRTGNEKWSAQLETIKNFFQKIKTSEMSLYVWIVTDKEIRKR